MANRVTVGEVRDIISTSEENDKVQACIDTANVLVTEKLGSSTSISTAHKKKIEQWLAAHFVACSIERQTSTERIGETQAQFMGQSGKGLEATTYGQQVKVLDTTGAFSNLGKRKARVDTIEAFDMTD